MDMAQAYMRSLPSDQREQIFSDLFDKAVADMKRAVSQSAEMLGGHEGILLLLGAVPALYDSVVQSTTETVANSGKLPGDFQLAQVLLTSFDSVIQPSIKKLRQMIDNAADKDPKVAEALSQMTELSDKVFGEE